MSKTSILIVEDEHIAALDIQQSLEKEGYVVAGHANRGDTAFQLAKALCPDLVLMDIGLKGDMDGIETAKHIREVCDIPIIFLTALANQSILERARLVEPFGYILQPFNARELVDNIEMALYKHAMERKLRESESKFRSLIENSPDGIMLIDGEGKLIEWNPAAEQISGVKRSEVLGMLLSDVIFHMLPTRLITPDKHEHIKSQWKAAVGSKHTSRLDRMKDVEIATPSGERKIVQANGFAIKAGNGTLAGAIMRDITERKQVETKLHKLSQAVEQSANVIIITDGEGNIEYANPKFTELTGYTLAEVLKQNPRILRSGEHSTEYYDELWRTIKSGKVWHGEFHNRHKDGSLYWEKATIAPVFNLSGEIINFIANKENITEKKALEAVEYEQRRLTEALLDTVTALNSTLNLDEVLDRILENLGNLVTYDAAIVLLVEGYKVRKIRSHNRAQGTSSQPAIGDTQANLINVPILEEMRLTKQPCLIPDTRADSRWRDIPGMAWIRSFISAPINIRGHVAGLINTISTEADFFTPLHAQRLMAFSNQAAIAIDNARLFEQAHLLSVTDPLTELFNRRHFFETANIEFERHHRYGGALSVIMMDIDHFKNVNDRYGHAVGDMVIQDIAGQIKKSVRTVDIAARYGGEEFVILMPETGLDKARRVAERLRHNVNGLSFEQGGSNLQVTLSLGVAEVGLAVKSLDELLMYSDQALYAAKAAGRNRVECYKND
jgi:diguanylate cyclase (GGDEF)-like protein/PAS domain S-box-containing protein